MVVVVLQKYNQQKSKDSAPERSSFAEYGEDSRKWNIRMLATKTIIATIQMKSCPAPPGTPGEHKL